MPRTPPPSRTSRVQLLTALHAARAAARPVKATERGTTKRAAADGHEGVEEEWFYPPASAVQAEAHRLLTEHNLVLDLVDISAIPGEAFAITYELSHAPSGASKLITYKGPSFRASKFADLPHVGTATERYAWRCVAMRELAIPVEYPARARGEHGEATPLTPGGWGEPPSAVAAPELVPDYTRFTPEAFAQQLEAWIKHERSIRLASGSADEPTMVDAWRMFRGEQGLAVAPGARPTTESEYRELYDHLRNVAADHGYLQGVA